MRLWFVKGLGYTLGGEKVIEYMTCPKGEGLKWPEEIKVFSELLPSWKEEELREGLPESRLWESRALHDTEPDILLPCRHRRATRVIGRKPSSALRQLPQGMVTGKGCPASLS